jgi:cytoskeletal protein RodZ
LKGYACLRSLCNFIPKRTMDSERVCAVVAFKTQELLRSLQNNGSAAAAGKNKGDGVTPGEISVGPDLATATRRRCCTGMLLMLLTAVVFSGCEREQVNIPSENISPPASRSSSASQSVAPPVQQDPPVARTPEALSQQAPAAPPAAGPSTQKRSGVQRAPTAVKKQHPEKLRKQEASKSPQRQASMQQVSQARGQLERGKPDAAIRTIEKAVRIDARNGEAFILLARAWKQKGEKRKALEFAKKAELLYQKQPGKLKEVFLLESDLYRELGDATNAVQSSRKASTVNHRGEEPGE